MKLLNSNWKTFALIVLMLFGTLVAAFFIITSGDAPPPDDAHLLPNYEHPPEELNGYHALRPVFRNIVSAQDLGFAYDSRQEFLDGSTLEEAKQVLEANEEIWPQLKKALALPYFEVPPVVDPDDTDIAFIEGTRELTFLLETKIHYERQTGNPEAAWEWNRVGFEFSRKLVSARGVLLFFMMAQVAERRFQEIAVELLATPPPPDIATWFEQQRQADKLAALQETLRAEYLFAKTVVEAAAEGDFPLAPEGPAGWLQKRLLKRNHTAQIFADFYTRNIEAMEIPVGPRLETLEDANIREIERLNDWKTMLQTGNFFGPDIAATMIPAISNVMVQMVHSIAQDRLLLAAIALRQYYDDHNALPDSLDALVPEYLDDVPADPWDGRPVRWDTKRRLLWSMGSDLVDDGGNPPSADEHMEPNLELPFGGEEAATE